MAVSTQKYSLIQRVLHWLTLALLLVSFVSHDWMTDAWRAVTRDAVADFTPDTGTQVHVITGGLILVLTLLRLWLRVKQGAPAPVSGQHPLITMAMIVMEVARREKLYAGWQQAVAATLAFHVD